MSRPPTRRAPTPARGFLDGCLAPHRRLERQAAVASLAAGVAIVAQAGAIAWLVHAVVIDGEKLPFAAIVLALGAILFRFLMQWLRDRSGQRLALAVRADVRAALRKRVDALGPLGVTRLGDSGRWASRYQGEVEALAGYFAKYLPARNNVFAVPLVIIAAVFWLDWLAALLLLFSAPLIPLFMALVGMGSEQVQAAQQHEQHRLAGHFLDRLRAIDLLRRSGALDAATAEVGAASDRYRVLTMRVLRIAFLSSAVMEFFSAVAIGLVAIYIGFGLLGSIAFGPAPELTLFSGLFVLLLAPEFFAPLRQFAQSYHDRAGALAAAASLAPVLHGALPDSAPVAASPSPADADAPALVLESVELAHADQGSPVLRNVSLHLAQGEQAVVTGPSGSGKSTLLAACASFLAPRSGHLVRGSDGDDRFAWLGQSAHLFHGSIRSNLLLAAQAGADDGALCAALADAGLPVEDPALPEGLDTQIGEGRRGLSGGQAQRVGIARAVLSNSPLWLVDEPTRGLDPDTAAAVLDSILTQARAHRVAVLVASHDAPVIDRFARRFTIVEGTLVEVADAGT